MKDRVKKAVEDYNRKYMLSANNEGAFYATDINQIVEMTQPKGSVTDFTYALIVNALKAGFMIGYRKAQRDARKKK